MPSKLAGTDTEFTPPCLPGHIVFPVGSNQSPSLSSPTVTVGTAPTTLPSVPAVPIPQTTSQSHCPHNTGSANCRQPQFQGRIALFLFRRAANELAVTPSFSVAPPSITIPSPSYQLPPLTLSGTPPSEATRGAYSAAKAILRALRNRLETQPPLMNLKAQ